MEEEIYVSCHAPSLSLLLFETIRSVHDQKGLLIGQVCNEIISKKTDENEMNREHKTAIYLEHCIPIEDMEVFESTGNINKVKLKKLSNVLQNRIVGWYSFRRNSKLIPNTLREHLIHKSFLELFPNMKCQHFVACFLSCSAGGNMSTHASNYIFMNYDPERGKFQSLRLKIYTLSDKSVNSNGYLIKSPFPTSSSFENIIGNIQEKETPVKSVVDIQEKVNILLKDIQKKLQKADICKLNLEQEVEALRKRLRKDKKNGGNNIIEETENKKFKTKSVCYDPLKNYDCNKQDEPFSFSTATSKLVPQA